MNMKLCLLVLVTTNTGAGNNDAAAINRAATSITGKAIAKGGKIYC